MATTPTRLLAKGFGVGSVMANMFPNGAKMQAFLEQQTPILDLRHRALTTAVTKEFQRERDGLVGHGVLIELGAGISGRSLEMTNKDGLPEQNFYYIETDSKDVIDKRRDVMRRMTYEERISERVNLMRFSCDFLQRAQISSLQDLLSQIARRKYRITFSEDLLLRYSHEAKETFLSNLHALLSDGSGRSGCFITTGVVTRRTFEAWLHSLALRDGLSKIPNGIKHDLVSRTFESSDEAEEMFSNAGFDVERHYQVDYIPPEFVCNYSPDIHRTLSDQPLWILRPRSK
jgi:hypothetical protein